MKLRHILFTAFLAVLVTGGIVWGVTNKFSDTVLLQDGVDLQLGTDGDFASDFDSGNQRIRLYDADSNLLGHITDGGTTAALYIEGTIEASGNVTAANFGDVEDLSTSGGSGTAPLSDGASGLAMTDVLTEAELDSEAELESQLSDVTDVLTDNDTIAGSQIGIHATTAETTIADDDEVLLYDASATANRRMTKVNFVAGISGSFTNFTLSGDAGSDQTIENGNTLEIAGDDWITMTAGATDTVTATWSIAGAGALGASPATDDYIPLYDTDVTTNKKLTIANLFAGGHTVSEDNYITMGDFRFREVAATGNFLFGDVANGDYYWECVPEADGVGGELLLYSENYQGTEVTSVTANTIDVTGTAMVHLDCSSDVDVYTLSNDAGLNKRVTLINVDATYDVTLHDGDGNMEFPDDEDITLGELESVTLDYVATDSTNKWVLASQGSERLGKGAVVLMAASGKPNSTGGCGDPAIVTFTDNDIWVMPFDPTTDESAWWMVAIPSDYTGGTFTASFTYTVASDWAADTDKVVWGVSAAAMGNSDACSTALGTVVYASDVWASGETTDEILQIDASSEMTGANTPAAGDFLLIKVMRDADNVNDTCTADARLISVRLEYARN